LPEALTIANKRADDLTLELAKSEKAREKAELDAASVESLRKILHDAEDIA
jgi:division protein CdvB (Snf7/Vps24/ESCRT-III family)